MADNSEYNRLVSEKKNKQSQYNACSRRISNNKDRIAVLKEQKENVKELKSLYKTNMKATIKIHDEAHKWIGSTYNKYHSRMNKVEDADEYYYKHSLDHVLDAINDEITRLENEQLKERGLLGRLGSAINSLANEIENWFN